MRDVEGRVAFITGGGSGVGLGMAKAFVAAGMRVAIADIRADHLEAALAELDGDVHAIRLDVPGVLDCDLQVRERLRFMAWMRRVQADGRRAEVAPNGHH